MATKYIVDNVSGQNINGDLTVNGNFVITGTTNIRPYKVYTALLTQSGTDAPVATILENTIGDIVWSYSSPGNFLATLNGAFTENKTVCPPFDYLTTYVTLPIYGSNYSSQLYQIGRANNDVLLLKIIDNGQGNVDWFPSFVPFIEIRVYN